MPAGERRVDRTVPQEISVPVAFSGTLAGGNVLHGCVNQKRVDQRLQFEISHLSRVGMVTLDSPHPNSCESSSKSRDRDVGTVLVEDIVSARQAVFNMPVCDQQTRCAT